MVSQRLKKHANELVYLQKARPCIRKHLITKADRSLVDCLCECADNILRGNVPLTKLQKKKLAKNKAGLRVLTKKSFSQKEESDLTERWIFGMPTSTDCLCSSTVALYFASMKELNLMNRYHQTRGRPKPPVEQRVKVMDTLDKKIQSILEREDLSTDERLKLYDQSFTRYLNVHDDYRPRPVVSRVSTSPPAVIETETKDAMEEEILESVPKTMKTKAELLVRKMKADPNIAWSEKGELKYKEETVRGSNVVDLVNDAKGNTSIHKDGKHSEKPYEKQMFHKI